MTKKTIFALALLAAGCSWPLRSEGGADKGAKDPMTQRQELFRRIESLKKARNLKPESVSKALELTEELEQVSENDHFRKFEAEPVSDAFVSRVEARVQKDASRGGAVIVDLREGLGISLDDVEERFGRQPQVIPPDPRAPEDEPILYRYSSGDGDLSFGFTRGKPRTLVSVTYQRKAKQP